MSALVPSTTCDGSTVAELVEAAYTLPMAAQIAWRVIHLRPQTPWRTLLELKTNMHLVSPRPNKKWTPFQKHSWESSDVVLIEMLQVEEVRA